MFVYLSGPGTVMFAAWADALLPSFKDPKTMEKGSCLGRNY